MDPRHDPRPLHEAARTAPLSTAQERLWFIDAAAPGSAAYNVPLLLRWRGAVDVAALTAALTAVTARHEVLRTVYALRDGQPVQIVVDAHPVPVDTVACAVHPTPETVDREARRPFDLAARPPLRCTVWHGAPEGDLVLLNIHHIAVDGWSLLPLFTDLAEAYRSAVDGATPRLPDLPLQYAEYAAQEKEACSSPAIQRKLAERADHLRSCPGHLVLGERKAQSLVPEGARRGAQHTFRLDPGLWTDVADLAARLRATPYTVLLAAFQTVVQRWSARERFILGTVAADRRLPDLEKLVGFFVNTVPLICHPEPDQSFEELCLQVRAEAYRALTLSRLPYDRLSAAAAPGRAEAGLGPLVEIGFGLQNMPVPPTDGRVAWEAPELLATGSAKFGLLLLVEEGPDGVRGTVEYDLDLYGPELAEAVADQFQALLAAALADPACALRRLPLTRRPPGAVHPGIVQGERRDLVAERMALLAAGHGGNRS
ncbi:MULTISPECIES: condensation domain-containing protein [unclassified Streptomyces]|uniref:condensation domain-containing protein n=1 Tax=unclassified Streptomyces TaxID=2593676 RepID=UPI0006917118|nr:MULTISPECIES: condensation domain-containing protein [unclassified Streptomyces]